MSHSQLYLNLAVNGLVEGLIIAMAALGITLVYAVAKFPNAATGDFMTFSAYTAKGASVLAGGSLVFGAGVAVLASALLAALAYLLIFRRLAGRKLVAPLVVSIGLAFLIRNTLTFFVGTDPTVLPVPIVRAVEVGGIFLQPLDLAVAAGAAISLAAAFIVLHKTPIGRRMRAVAGNADLARVSGIRAGRVMLQLWLLVGMLAAVAGVLLAAKSVIEPEMGWHLLLPAFAAAILGGVGSPIGALVGGVLIGLAQELSVPLVGSTYKAAVGFVVILVVLLVRPSGLLGRDRSVR
ncbi:branched-chain amino acid ABC transporter permease [Aquibium sp. A9E412]|uniref:branched-chain amino acid ABC transporter permease n=1 Tax=Aquibium sp. A9E412 TaxID=2976767 RepID=UPI0025B05785|nr:branched-chain amino acid ABC transporter permease [Aquibium sp. A9E412]MDN2567304.1 branched-chain amino acid ABC transporter permease [Aquibium sp. A9E412]